MRSHHCGSAGLAAFALLLAACGKQNSKQLERKGDHLYQAKRFAEAVEAYSEAIEADPKNFKALQSRGLTKSMQGDWPGCVEDLDRALAIAPENRELLDTRAFAHLHTGDYELAEKDYARIDELADGAGTMAKFKMAKNLMWRARGRSMGEEEEKRLAVADFNRVIALHPNDMMHYERACTLLELGDFEAALTDLDLVIEIDGDISRYGDPHDKRADAKRGLGDEVGAKADEAEAERRLSRAKADPSPL